MVRAPPCHGGSCGFEPRLPRIFAYLFVAMMSMSALDKLLTSRFFSLLGFSLILIIFCSCTEESLSLFRHEGEALSKELIAELKKIRVRDDLIEHAPRLKELFDSLVEIMIRAQKFKENHLESIEELAVHKEAAISDQLRIELNRILHMEGGREVIERVQESALNRLDAFEKGRLAKN